MKINAKLNGVNHKLHSVPYSWMRQPFIVFGEPDTVESVSTEWLRELRHHCCLMEPSSSRAGSLSQHSICAGADVTHPVGFVSNVPSVAAVVRSAPKLCLSEACKSVAHRPPAASSGTLSAAPLHLVRQLQCVRY